MRIDYFTLCEIARVVRADPQRMKGIFASYDDFPVKRVGSRYVIPKGQFFTWWDRHRRDEVLRYRFDVQQIEDARNEYIKSRLDMKIMARRRYRA